MELTFTELNEASEVVRAMDEAMNVRPQDLYWNVMGMMNRCWFRVVIHRDGSGKFRFEHPTVPALNPGGLMERVKQAGGDLQDGNWGEEPLKETAKKIQAQIVMTNPEETEEIPMERIEKHDKDGGAWFIVNRQVYDCT